MSGRKPREQSRDALGEAEGTSPTLDAMEAPVYRDRPVSFVRRSGRMSEAQDRAWAELSPTYLLPVERGAAATSVRPGSRIDPVQVYGRRAPLIVEIGSGQGHQIVAAASARPDTDFLAVEVFSAGLARTMLDADRVGARNLRLVEANAPEVLEHLLPAAAVADQMRAVLDEASDFERSFPGEWAERFEGRVLTAFERKGIRVGRDIRDLTYTRLAP